MAIPSKVLKFLDAAKIKYELVKHRTVYTAYDKAATLKVLQKIVGKTLVIKLDRSFALVLIPANKNLEKDKLKKIIKAKKIDFVSERIIINRLKGVTVGAIPPFGILWRSCLKVAKKADYHLPTFIDRSLLIAPKIFLNAGDYNFSIKINGADLRKLIPDCIVGSFGKTKKIAKKKTKNKKGA